MLFLSLLLCAALASHCSADIAENFENGIGKFWMNWVDDAGGHWVPAHADGESIPARPVDDAGVLMVVPEPDQESAAAHLYSPLMSFPENARIRLKFWIRASLESANNLLLMMVEDNVEKPAFLDLTQYAKPDNNKWLDVEVAVPETNTTFSHICLFGFRHSAPLDAVAIDDLVLVGVDGSETPLPLSSGVGHRADPL